MKPIRLMTVAPGHFHAALVQKRMPPGVHPRAYVYAPLDADLLAHLDRVAAFNARPDAPTAWDLDVRAGADYLGRFLREQPGNTVVLSGKNRPKIGLMRAAVAAGLHVLADKPWVVEPEDFAALEDMLADADLREVLVWDVMTERHEITTRLQRELTRDPDLFGDWLAGSAANPALTLESTHYLKKTVAGRPLRRPWWWFDAATSGEAMADVGTHLADLALWLVCPDRAVDHRRDVALLDADRWPLVLSRRQFAAVTGRAQFPPELAPRVVGKSLYYAGNNTATFALRGVHVKLTTLWDYEAAAGGDTHAAVARGTKATVSVRQDRGGSPEVYVAATDPARHSAMVAALRRWCAAVRDDYPGLGVDDYRTEAKVVIPGGLRTGHEDHFGAVVEEFVRYFHAPRTIPPWERANVLTRYFLTTRAVALARQKRPYA